jgi:hypothetical protein
VFRYISQVDAPVVPGTARREPEVRCGRATRRTDQGDGARGAVALLGVCLLALNLMALIGLLARDRSVLLAILFYLRLLPLGGAAIAFDLTRRGRGIGKPRFLLAAIGLITVACSGWEMIGRGPEVPTTPRARPKGEVRLEWHSDFRKAH